MSSPSQFERMSTGVPPSKCGLLLLGNTGVGKSFLANILLDREAFVHESTSNSVTHFTELEECHVGHTSYAIFNIPGLIEADQARVDMNKAEIYKAFQLRPTSIVAFIFGSDANLRLRDEDIITFKATNEAYRFQSESLLFIINGLPGNRPQQYEGETIVKLEELLQMKHIRTCFLNRINREDKNDKIELRLKLVDAIFRCTPRIHERHSDIKLNVDVMKELQTESEKEQNNFESRLASLQAQIIEKQKEFELHIAQQPREIYHYHEKLSERVDMCVIC
ncbi:unnamed protein product [Didymodactylos carnosus]|uniref:AIG1-type G domain-containing protein n=1 Tax=Didymodactylos carnosus TaxID=1234261 RepID=A0A815YIB9_9BILA|nr:unnamed protein product [Didymodactylos carnosus]CAF1571308.1 unnamed protein product [Didymodactylos carnosus]CAF4231755.1 unnamed protein product [Didymodactylos carnosus]CAF4434772.1 unnamed protein product [Didymodactylos carnosus]